MITGTIAVVFIVAMIASAGDGEWGAFAVGAVIVVFLLALGAASREDDRAYLNWRHYWATGEPLWKNNGKRTTPQRAGHVSRREKREAAEKRRRYIEERRRAENDPSYVDGLRTAGVLMQTQRTTHTCPMCDGTADEFNRVQYSSGSVFVNYMCRRCGRKWPVKIK